MKTITKITRQKNNQERYNIYLDDEYAFAVDEGILIKFGLMKGKTLEQFDIDEINYEDEIAKAFSKALHFLSFQMRSEYEVKKKLLDAGHGEAVVLEAVRKLESLGFLNDETYSKALLETKKRTLKKGPRAIRQDLKKKGIDKVLQDEVLETFTQEEQLEIAMQLAEKEVRAGSRRTPTQLKQKIQDVLMRKGYSFSIVSDVLEQIKLERAEDEWEELIASQGEKVWRKFASKLSGAERNIKIKQALYQKGFPIEVINRFIEEKEREQG
ncbi:recombination regulator RecX [Lysinibacillus odysseyi]|uniref:Regulatory protein RecX n=1 Tax=Lysinibacillus odysseyi 34hs-1 = NBRC 100172 TaxID=1220589 RepID=A0A0A3IUE7_9BACI|nr:recombination regulator RecX [Lysinibacillus odysseyi]KGR88291.1 recombinase RecA [Lysinibacillus odysseyi 34hs-1 = NBRC 100172]